MKTRCIEIVREQIESRKCRSAWDRGVNAYALELLEEVVERAEWEGRLPEPGHELLEFALNGAESWKAYSWGGSSLIYNEDIAKRMCTPSELKRTRNGERRPNKDEEWLDTQARALYQAFVVLKNRYASAYQVEV